MTQLNYYVNSPYTETYYADNHEGEDFIRIYINNFIHKKRFNFKKFVNNLNVIHLTELICLLRQREVEAEFTNKCEQMGYSYKCPCEKILRKMGYQMMKKRGLI